LLATFNALVAGVNTALHDRVIVKQAAAFGTGFAGSSANTARRRMKCRSSQHKIGAEATEFGAVHHGCGVPGFRVRSSSVQAVLNGLQANGMTVGAVMNAVVHHLVHAGVNSIRFVMMGHGLCLSERE
jgi:hypothetical protein